MDINTYPNMNAKIVELLRLDRDNYVCLYAAKRIEELEQLVQQQRKAINDLIRKKEKAAGQGD